MAWIIGLLAAVVAAEPASGQECLIGEVRMFAGNFAPKNWALAQGQLLPIVENTALFSILGTTYGGDGATTFALPDLRGPVPLGTGQGAGLSHNVLAVAAPGAKGPKPEINVYNAGPADVPLGATAIGSGGAQTTQAAAPAIEATGGGQPHPVMPPYLGINYIICRVGIFPAPN